MNSQVQEHPVQVVRRQPLFLPEELTRQFYAWERRGRGWQVWDRPVALEPPFEPFYYYLPDVPTPDDGRREPFVQRLINTLFGRRDLPMEAVVAVQESPPALPDGVLAASSLCHLQVILPRDMKVAKETAGHFLLNLAYCQGLVCFELIATHNAIVVQFTCEEPDGAQVHQQLRAHYPDIRVTGGKDALDQAWRSVSSGQNVIVDFGLSNEFVRPLRSFRNFDADPFVGVFGALDSFAPGDVGVFQVLFQPVRCPWAESILHSVTDWEGDSFFVDAPEMPALARQKIAQPLFAAVLRVAGKSAVPQRAWHIVRNLGSGLSQFGDPSSNELIPLNNDEYPNLDHLHALLKRQTRRSGMILNAEELVSLVHLPSLAVRAEKLNRKVSRTKTAPDNPLDGEVVLGLNTHNGRTKPVTLSADQRVRHMYVVGASGTGKSTLLLTMITQDIEAGRGIGVMDPHGDLIDDILARIPEHRHKDVVLFDPSDSEHPIGFNILAAHSELEKTLIASDLVAVFQRLSTSWGDQMTTVLSNAILAILESERGGTLSDLRHFLVDKSYRQEFLKTVQDRDVVYYWEKEFPLLVGRPQGPILTRLDAFLRPKLIRYMVGQKENRLDFADIMNSGKIFLAKLSQGAIGEENAYLLGTLLVSKFHQVTLSRQEMQVRARRPFYLYIDEFQNFLTPSMASILSGVRKYRLGLVLAHQELRQLEKRDSEVASAALSNPHTRVCFRVGEADAKKLAEGMSYFESTDLLNLGTGQALGRIERAECDFSLTVSQPKGVDVALAEDIRNRIVTLSRKRYGTPLDSVVGALEKAWTRDDEAKSSPIKVSADKPSNGKENTTPVEVAPIAATTVIPTEKPKGTVSKTLVMGKGGPEHRYLQQLIKRMGEGLGYRATIEKQLGEGASVDVVLEKGKVSIACEIAVTTSPGHELDNLKKCLACSFTYIMAVSNDAKKLGEIECMAREHFTSTEVGRIHFVDTGALFQYIETMEVSAAYTEQTVRGYKVKVKYRHTDEVEGKSLKRAVSQVILGAMGRK
ncbi:MAG: hypothetical protein AMXMBFR84_42350 [Candidatus Hydrogenedentota bacterium]